MKNPNGTFELPQVDALTPYKATRLLFETLPLDAIEQVIRALEGEDQIPEENFTQFRSLSWEQVGAIHKAGFTIGSHTRSHVLMTRESIDRIQDEMAGSKQELESRLGSSVQHIAYPSGQFDTASVNVAAQVGYRFGF